MASMKRLKQTILIVLLFICMHSVNAQKPIQKEVNEYVSIDRKALQMPDSLTKTTEGIAYFINHNFITSTDKARAIFIWIATNIQYDIDNMFALNFYESKEDKIAKALKTRKGICENYAALFTDVCSKTGIKSFVIEGYTKQNGFTDYIPHAWCAALIDGSWLLFDPTWGSGFVNGGKFYKKINNAYYKINPPTLLKSHMPFDFLWQLVNYPITNQEFYEGKIQQDKSKPYFSYADSIETYEKQNHIEQLIASAKRIEENGIKNSLIYDRLQHIKLEIDNDRQNQIISLYNAAVFNYNEGINNFNAFIQYRNKQFIPMKTDPEIQHMMDVVVKNYADARAKLSTIKNPDASSRTAILQLTQSIDDATTHVKEQQEWLRTYFSKGKSGRKSMFFERKVTWFGIPLN